MFSFLEPLFRSKVKRDCLLALQILDSLFKNESAYPPLKKKVSSAIVAHHPQDNHIMDYMQNADFTPKEKTLYIIEALALRELSSNKFSQPYGILSKLSESLCSIYKIATEELVKSGHYNEKDRQERLKTLNDVITAGRA